MQQTVETDHLARRMHQLRADGKPWHLIGRQMMLAPGPARRIYFAWLWRGGYR